MKKSLSCFIVMLLLLIQHSLFAQTQQLIGCTSSGGAKKLGIMYKVNPDGSGFTPIYSFTKATGYNPTPLPMLNTSGNLNVRYGMCRYGGAHDSGCIFSYDVVKNTYTDLFNFNTSSGGFPLGGLTLASNGLFYGTTNVGGGNTSNGTIFSFNPETKAFTVLFRFINSSYGINPNNTLLQGSDGKLYGTAGHGGQSGGGGVIFAFSITNNSYTPLYSFGTDGYPSGAAFIQDSHGVLYSYEEESYYDQQNGVYYIDKITYKFNPVTNSYFRIHTIEYTSGTQGDQYGTLTFDLNKQNILGVNNIEYNFNNLYFHGEIFSITVKDSSYHVVFDFPESGIDGNILQPLVNRNPNNYYGVTTAGGVDDSGVMYHYFPAFGGYIKLHDFTGHAGGSLPYGMLTGVACTQHPAKPGAITGTAKVKCNKTYKYSIKSLPGTTSYVWAVPAGATIQGASTDTAITVLWGKTSGDITVQAKNTCGTSAKQTKTITVSCTQKELITDDAFAVTASGVTPNPTTGNITLHFTSSALSKYTINVVDITGKILSTHEVNAVSGSNTAKFDLSNLAKGIYYIQLNGEADKQIFKVVLE